VLEGHHDAEAAEQLNAQGGSRSTSAPFDASSVSKTRNRCGQPTLWARLLDAGMLTTPEVAVALGGGIKTVANWAKAGRLRGKRCGRSPRARWLFEPFAEQTEPIRKRVAARTMLKRRRGVPSDEAAGQGAI